jgi:hypothetical protein
MPTSDLSPPHDILSYLLMQYVKDGHLCWVKRGRNKRNGTSNKQNGFSNSTAFEVWKNFKFPWSRFPNRDFDTLKQIQRYNTKALSQAGFSHWILFLFLY